MLTSGSGDLVKEYMKLPYQAHSHPWVLSTLVGLVAQSDMACPILAFTSD